MACIHLLMILTRVLCPVLMLARSAVKAEPPAAAKKAAPPPAAAARKVAPPPAAARKVPAKDEDEDDDEEPQPFGFLGGLFGGSGTT